MAGPMKMRATAAGGTTEVRVLMTHPMTTANRLHKSIHGSRLEVARTPYGVVAWPGLFAEHVVTSPRT